MGLGYGGMVTAEGTSPAMPLRRASGAAPTGQTGAHSGGEGWLCGQGLRRVDRGHGLLLPGGSAWRHFVRRVTETSQKRQTPCRHGEILL